MTVICETWPSISPWNIWDLRYGDWLGFSESADQIIEARSSKNP